MAFSERICSNSLRWFGTKKVVLEDFLESDSDREFLLVGQKKKKKNRTPHRKRKQNSEDNVASVCEQDARKTCGNESTIYYECGFKAILKRAFSSECKTKSTRSTFLVLVFKKKSLWRDKFLFNACNDIFPSQSARFGNINILFDLFVKYIY